jgi:hypothetical protein
VQASLSLVAPVGANAGHVEGTDAGQVVRNREVGLQSFRVVGEEAIVIIHPLLLLFVVEIIVVGDSVRFEGRRQDAAAAAGRPAPGGRTARPCGDLPAPVPVLLRGEE